MWIILKFTLKKIKEHKFRTFLIIFSITLSVALLFASLAIQGTVGEMYLDMMKRFSGSSEIVIRPGDDSPSYFFRTNRAETHKDKFDYVIGFISTGAFYKHSSTESINVNLMGYNYGDLQIFNPVTLVEANVNDLEGNQIIIGMKAARDYDIQTGDNIKLEINGVQYHFKVAGIAASEGLFRPDENAITIIASRDKLARLNWARGRVSAIYIKTNENTSIDDAINILREEYPRYRVNQTINPGEALAYVRQMTTTFMLMLPLVVFISIFIIYTSFKVITLERLPIIGTFRSIGATRFMTDTLLLSESLFYGVIGGIFGIMLGFLVLYIMMMTMSYDDYNNIQMKTQMIYSYWQILVSFGGALCLSIISSLIPIVRISKIPVKDIVLNNIRNKVSKGNVKLITGLLLIILSIFMPTFVPDSIALYVDLLCLVFLGSGIILLVPYITNLLVKFFEKVYGVLLGNEGILAARNLHGNKSIMNNISLLTIGIAAILMITNISNSAVSELLSIYNDGKFDVMTYISGADRRIASRLRSVDGVIDVYETYLAGNVSIIEKNQSINIYGIEGDTFFNYWDFDFIGDKEHILQDFSDGRNIILSQISRDKYGYKEGDIITLKTARGNKPYQIAGFTDTLMNLGNVAFANNRYFKRDMEMKYYSDMYLRTSEEPEEVNQKIKDKFSRGRYVWSTTMDDMQEREMRSNGKILTLLTGFSYIIMIIGVVGIFNNFMVGLMSRKRVIAVMRSVGMSKFQLIKILFIESMTGGLIGGMVGSIGGFLFIKLAEYMLVDINIPLGIHYLPSMFINVIFIAALISVIASISPAIKTSKYSIIESIKYE